MAQEDLLKRVPPYSIEAEQACIGAMLMSPKVISSVVEILKEDDFFDEKHRIIFNIIKELYEKNAPVDVVSVTERLNNTGNIQKVGGSIFISKLIESVPAISNIEYYVKIVWEKSILRELINACRTIIDSVYENQSDLDKIADDAEKLIFEVTDRKLRTNYYLLKDVLSETLKGIERLHHARHVYTGIPTGFIDFDEKTSGLQNGSMVVIAARPSMGKTAFALNIATNLCREHNDYAVLIFSLEMSYQEIVLRMLSSESRIEMQRLRKGMLHEYKGEWKTLVDAAGALSEMKILIDDTPAISLNEIRSKSRRAKSKYNLKLIIIDHLQLITTGFSASSLTNRNNEISYISRSIKALAKELDLPIVVLSQLSRSVDVRGGDHRPILSDLRESGAIEQDADIVAFLYREEYYNRDTDKKNIAELLLQKQRNGPTGDIQLVFLSEIVRFENMITQKQYLDMDKERQAQEDNEF